MITHPPHDPEFGNRLLADEAKNAGEVMCECSAWWICRDNRWWSAFADEACPKRQEVRTNSAR